jgi:hypothetical protein
MTMTYEDSKMMGRRDELTPDEVDVISEGFSAMYSSAKAGCVSLAGDDRAAALEAAMIRFIFASRKD